MRHYTTSGNRVRSLSAEIRDDDEDGSPTRAPRIPRGRRTPSRRTTPEAVAVDRKAWQLCRQVGHTLDAALAECRDAVLQGLRVENVEPFPDASRLLVTIAFIDDRPGCVDDLGRVLDRLEHASGHLRAEVAMAVTRKRAPLLLYRLADPPAAVDRSENCESSGEPTAIARCLFNDNPARLSVAAFVIDSITEIFRSRNA